MTKQVSSSISLRKVNLEKAVKELRDPIIFARRLLDFKPIRYQAALLKDPAKRIVARFSRQAGKTTTIAVRAIWFATVHPRTVTLIVAPSMRQSMIMMDRIQGFLMGMPKKIRRRIIAKMQRTVIWFRNGSQIVALPNSPHLLRGYTAHQVICDEAAFFRDDELVFYNVLYPMLATTDGQLIVSSTPWGKNTVFYKMNNNPEFSKHVVTANDVVKAGLIKRSFIEEMRKQLPAERFRREFLSEFIEDADAYFPQDLIVKCIVSDPLVATQDWNYYPFEYNASGQFTIGVDFGKKVDYSVIAVIDKLGEKLRLVHLHQFPLETAYASVIGYVKALSDRYKTVGKVLCDQTGVGEYIVEDMARANIPGVEGVTLTLPVKQEILGYLKQQMQNDVIQIPYDSDLIAEINVERFELMKGGQMQFSHPEGTHDDRLWALALAVWATRGVKPTRPLPTTRTF